MNNINVPMPDISPKFTIEDIHKIREWNYERRKGMTTDERISDVNCGAQRSIERIEAARRAKQSIKV